jgi:hypothetical protein
MKTVAMLIPLSWTHVSSNFFMSFTQMFAYAMADYRVNVISSKAAYLDRGREELIGVALGTKPDYIMWIDADQIYQHDTVKRLTKHIDDGLMVVNGVVPMKDESGPLAFKLSDAGTTVSMIKDLKMNSGLVKVDLPAGGGVMMNPKVYSMVSPPYYMRTEAGPSGMRIGEDVTFFWKLKQAGVESWIDTDLHFGHLSERVVGIVP